MKKIINKLFEWLGYVPKGEYEAVLRKNELMEQHPTRVMKSVSAHEKAVRNGTATWHYIETQKCFMVLEYCDETGDNHIVKVFPYYDDDSKEYARICAEELCEMLNEKY